MAAHEGSKDSYTMGGGEEVPPNVARREKGKLPYNRDKGKGKGKQQEFAPKLRCFICDGSHLARECPKREVLNTLIKKSEKKDEEAHLGSMQMLSALQFISKASSQGSKAREQAKVSSLRGAIILTCKEKLVGKRG